MASAYVIVCAPKTLNARVVRADRNCCAAFCQVVNPLSRCCRSKGTMEPDTAEPNFHKRWKAALLTTTPSTSSTLHSGTVMYLQQCTHYVQPLLSAYREVTTRPLHMQGGYHVRLHGLSATNVYSTRDLRTGKGALTSAHLPLGSFLQTRMHPLLSAQVSMHTISCGEG